MNMRLSLAALVASLVAGCSDAFLPTNRNVPISRGGGTPLASSYLETLSGADYAPPPSVPPTPYSVPAVVDESASSAASTFSHASLGYFDVGNMASKGPRATKDWGTPQDATRMLDDDGTFKVGSWYCSEGGWPSPNPKAHTEIFYMLDGHGCLGDADGTKHYFGPGDVVIIPKGHTGRWDVFTPIHKVWAVNDHEKIEETAYPIRVVVEHYHNLAPQYMAAADSEPLFGMEDFGKTRTFYDVGPTKVGAWTCDSGASFPFANGSKRVFIHMLEGALFVTDSTDGSARRCVAGDTVMLPAGFSGYIDVIEAAKHTWTVAE